LHAALRAAVLADVWLIFARNQLLESLECGAVRESELALVVLDGCMYKHSQGVQQDHDEAARWYRLAGEQGNVNAQNNLGTMYADGQGVKKDDAEAVRWYRMTAEQLKDGQSFVAWALSSAGNLHHGPEVIGRLFLNGARILLGVLVGSRVGSYTSSGCMRGMMILPREYRNNKI